MLAVTGSKGETSISDKLHNHKLILNGVGLTSLIKSRVVFSPLHVPFIFLQLFTLVSFTLGIVNALVDKMSMSTATPNKPAVLSRGMDQGKGGRGDYCGIRTQFDPATCFRSPMRDVNFLDSDFKCRRNVKVYRALCQDKWVQHKTVGLVH